MTNLPMLPGSGLDLPITPMARELADTLDRLYSCSNGNDKIVFDRPLPSTVSRALRNRLHQVADTLKPNVHDHEIAAVISRMLSGFSGSQNIAPREAAAIVAQYVTVVKSYPMWAVVSACNKFGSNNISDDECRGWNRAHRPSTAQLCQVIGSIVGPLRVERSKMLAVLNAEIQPSVSDVDKEQIKRGLMEVAASMSENAEAERASKEDGMIGDRRKFIERSIEREWKSMGVEPLRSGSIGMLVSRSLVNSIKEQDARRRASSGPRDDRYEQGS